MIDKPTRRAYERGYERHVVPGPGRYGGLGKMKYA